MAITNERAYIIEAEENVEVDFEIDQMSGIIREVADEAESPKMHIILQGKPQVSIRSQRQREIISVLRQCYNLLTKKECPLLWFRVDAHKEQS